MPQEGMEGFEDQMPAETHLLSDLAGLPAEWAKLGIEPDAFVTCARCGHNVLLDEDENPAIYYVMGRSGPLGRDLTKEAADELARVSGATVVIDPLCIACRCGEED